LGSKLWELFCYFVHFLHKVVIFLKTNVIHTSTCIAIFVHKLLCIFWVEKVFANTHTNNNFFTLYLHNIFQPWTGSSSDALYFILSQNCQYFLRNSFCENIYKIVCRYIQTPGMLYVNVLTAACKFLSPLCCWSTCSVLTKARNVKLWGDQLLLWMNKKWEELFFDRK
jgi:hypothetical protein